jgi:hypothetical protein
MCIMSRISGAMSTTAIDSCQQTMNISTVVMSSVKTALMAGRRPLSKSWFTESRSLVMRLIRSPMGWRSKNRSESVWVCSKTSRRSRYIASCAATASTRPPNHIARKPPVAKSKSSSRSARSASRSPSAIGPLMMLPTSTAGISARSVPTKLRPTTAASRARDANR